MDHLPGKMWSVRHRPCLVLPLPSWLKTLPLYQVLHGLDHMHGAGVIHRDIKPENILVNSSCEAKICDLGLARVHVPDQDKRAAVEWPTYVATRYYRAPELLTSVARAELKGRERTNGGADARGVYTAMVDMWSLGCVMCELLSRKVLFKGESSAHQLRIITHDKVCASPGLQSRTPAAVATR